MHDWSASVFIEVQWLESSHGDMVYIYSSVCVRRSAATREFTWCAHTHQCVFVEVQRLESSHGVHILISVCS